MVDGLRNLDDGYIPPIFIDNGGSELLDGKRIVRPRESIEWTRRLTEVGIFAGISSGAALAGAAKTRGGHRLGDHRGGLGRRRVEVPVHRRLDRRPRRGRGAGQAHHLLLTRRRSDAGVLCPGGWRPGQMGLCQAAGGHPPVADDRTHGARRRGRGGFGRTSGPGCDRKGIRTVSEGTIARRTTGRGDGRATDELRPASFERDFTVFAPGSVLVSMGRTRVLCTASIEERVPPWMRGSGKGWVTAEYSLLPGSTGERVTREAAKGKQSGRTQEIQRLIGRSLRSVCDMVALGEMQITVDCDVLQADGGTRTASICGAYVALHDALTRLVQKGTLRANPLTEAVAAVSVGVVDGVCMLDLPYEEDSRAEVDMNVVMTSSGRFIEVQGTAEGMPFTKGELDEMLSLAEHGIAQLLDLQAEVLAEPPPPR